MNSTLKIKESYRFDLWRNNELKTFIEESFKTEPERLAAWSVFAHICDNYSGVRELIRGKLVESVEL